MRELLGAPAGSADARASQAVRARARRLRRPWLSSAWTLLDALAEVEVDDGAAAGREGAGAAAARLRAVDVALSGGEASLFEVRSRPHRAVRARRSPLRSRARNAPMPTSTLPARHSTASDRRSRRAARAL
jgi:hypothetical protein